MPLSTTTTPRLRAARALWPHQRDAVAAAVKTLADHRRAAVVAACGSGKTAIGGEIAAQLVPAAGRLLFAAPSLELIGQTLREYRLGSRELGRVIAVCSDEAAVHHARVDLAAEAAVVTTDPRRLAALLAGRGPATVACTYQSLYVVRDAHARYGLAPWDLLVADEAHRTAGARGKAWALIHDDGALPAARRLYLTATPRIYAGEDEASASMDDESVFGPVAYRLTFGEAVECGLLADYRVVVPVITNSEILRLVAARGATPYLVSGGRALDPAVLAAQVALLRACAQYNARRMITYHGRVADAHAFAQSLHAAADLLEPHEQPVRLVSLAVDGRQEVERRRSVLSLLAADSQDTVVVTNARVLTEGVDIPAVDAVAFLTPRDSPEATTQAVGRALRRGANPEKVATIVIPIVLGPDETPLSALDGSSYAPVWRAIRALRAHDERLARQVDALRFAVGNCAGQDRATPAKLPDWISFTGAPVPEGFAAAITLRMVRETSPSWQEHYGRAWAYRERHGDLLPGRESEPELSLWLIRQRKARKDGLLSAEHIGLLDALGMSWTPHDEAWERALAVARDFHRVHGTVNAPEAAVWGEPPLNLGLWLAGMRRSYHSGTLSAARAGALDALGIDWNPRRDAWRRALAAARDYHRAHGTLNVLPGAVWGDPPFPIGRWIKRQREIRALLDQDQIDALDALGMIWTPDDEHFAARIGELAAHLRGHGGTLPTKSGAFVLYRWLNRQRDRYLDSALPPERAAQLDRVLGAGWAERPTPDGGWSQRLAQLEAFLGEHGELPTSRTDNPLIAWLRKQQRAARQPGALSPERAAALAQLLGPAWSELTPSAYWAARLDELRDHVSRHPGAPAAGDPARWLTLQRREHGRRGTLGPKRDAALRRVLGPGWADEQQTEPAPPAAAP